MFNDDGLGAAMAQSYVEGLAKTAQDKVTKLETRVEELEQYALTLTELLQTRHPEWFPRLKTDGLQT